MLYVKEVMSIYNEQAEVEAHWNTRTGKKIVPEKNLLQGNSLQLTEIKVIFTRTFLTKYDSSVDVPFTLFATFGF
jgi:hypothetical protein